jgi:predicted permease
MMEMLWQDIRYGARMLRKNAGFTAVTIITLSLGIGANTAIFTVINTVLLRSLPVKNPDELVQVVVISASGQPINVFSYPCYEQLGDGGQSLSGLFAAGGVGLRDRVKVAKGGDVETEFVRAQPVSGNFFSVLGVSAAVGRTFIAEDDRAGNPQAVAVISHRYWQRRFAGDRSVVGRDITFNDVPFTIVGITPPGFFGFQPGEDPEMWWPVQMTTQVDRSSGRLSEGSRWMRLMGRRSPGVGQRQAEAELAVSFQRYRENYLASREVKWSANQRKGFLAEKLELRSGHAGWTGLRGHFRLPLFILMSVVAMVLLIACANVASLLLARAAARELEFSVRHALGAGRLRLMRQLLTESFLLAGLSGLLGLLLAQGGTRLLPLIMQLPSDPISLSLTPDLRVMFFTTAAALLTGLLFGLAPAFRSSRIEVTSALKGASGSVVGHASRQRFHQALIVGQVALSLVLLIGAGLFARTLKNLQGLDTGFNRENVVLFNIDFAERPDAERWPVLYRALINRLEALPGVRAASLFSEGYLSDNGWSDDISAEGHLTVPGENLECLCAHVGPRFFETIGTPLLTGREFGQQDERPADPVNALAPGPAVINQAMVRRYFGNANPLGRHIFLTHHPEQRFEIVGLVPDAKYDSLRETVRPTFYLPFFRNPRNNWANFALRTGSDPRSTIAALAGVVREVDRTFRVRDVRTMDDVVTRAMHRERLIAQLGGFFSVFALGLACLGLHGVLSFAVVQRTREIGVRVALGAQRSDVLWLVIGKGLKLALAGIATGLVGGLGLTQLVSSLLYGVTPTDPGTWLALSLLLVLVASLATWLPARRATKVDPMVALRYE